MASFHTFIAYSLFILCFAISVKGQYDNMRCKCVCPDVSIVNGTTTDAQRKLYIANVEAIHCNCENVVVPQISGTLNGKENEFCPRCECKHESRSTMTIKVVVIIIIWIVSLLVVYMLFLMCLDPLLNKRGVTYQEHTNEEEELPPVASTSQRRTSSNVLNRVGHQQYKWKRQVQEQRRNIYDKHKMLN
uniref:Transmembrane protein 9 n=1 Tax=Strigamia maritima TaxID=126957 RepID=T1J2U0_STRMM